MANGQERLCAYIVQELVTGGELFDYVSCGGPFSESVTRYYFKQIISALHHCHTRGIAHRDLKPENILLDKNYDTKLIDFGFATPLEGRTGSGISYTLVGTPGYMAPEIVLGKPYQAPVVDLFATAVITFILFTGFPPFTTT